MTPAENSSSPIVFVIDDDSSVRKSLCRLLSSEAFEVEGFATAADFLVRKPTERSSCLVLDVQLPGLSGLDLQKELASSGLAPAIVFITGFGTVPMSVRAMKGGAIDFLQKPFEDRDLLDAVRRAIAVDTEHRLAAEERSSIQGRYARLTPREQEVFELVVSGLLNKQIASRLGTSEKTVKVHRGRVMRKMEANSLADLVRMGERLQAGNPGTLDQGPIPSSTVLA